MEIKIDVSNYLTHEEIKEECRMAIRSIIKEQFSKESQIQRLISNLGYEFIFEAVSQEMGMDAREAISEVVFDLASDVSHIRYEMWRRKDAWERTESPAITIMNEAIKENRDFIEASVRAAIKEFEFPDVRQAMYDMAQEVIYEKLFGGNGDDGGLT